MYRTTGELNMTETWVRRPLMRVGAEYIYILSLFIIAH